MQFEISKPQLTQKVWLCAENITHIPLPLYIDKISAGFPSPADGYLDKELDLNELMVDSPPSTFFVRVEGDSMTGAGIFSGDMLIVNRAKEPTDGKIIIAVLDGELTVKRLRIKRDQTIQLEAENIAYQPILVTKEREFSIWGVVTGVVRSL